MNSWKLALIPACSLGVGVMAAWAAPVQWTGTAQNTRVQLFVDGQKATGGVRASFPRGTADITLSGSGGSSHYSGTAAGQGLRGAQTVAVSGSWEASLVPGSARIHLKLQPQGGQTIPLSVDLSQTAYQPLRCAWLRGSATRKSGGATKPLRAGDGLRVGDAVETGAGSSAILVLADRSVVMMQERTRVEIPDVPDNRGQLQKTKVSSGKVWFAVRKVQQGSKFEVETTEAVASVRGTEFLVEVDDEGETSLTTAEGEVVVSDLQRTRNPIPVREGMAWRLPRRTPVGEAARWRPAARANLERIVERWGPLLDEADLHWPFRRAGKARFWQNRLKERHKASTLGPEGGHPSPPGAGRARPGRAADRNPVSTRPKATSPTRRPAGKARNLRGKKAVPPRKKPVRQ